MTPAPAAETRGDPLVAGLVLAAGEGSRFGGPKQLAELGGRPLIEHAVGAMLAARPVERVVVVLGAAAAEVRARADLGAAEAVVCERWEEGMSASVQTGVAALRDADAIVITLADQPLVSVRAIETVAEHAGGKTPAARATYDGLPGHPVMIKRELYLEVSRLWGEHGARRLLERVGAERIECAAFSRADDVDTPEDLERIRAIVRESEVSRR